MSATRRVRTRGAVVGALVGVAVLALAACGSSSSSGSGTSPTSQEAAGAPSTSASGSGAATVMAASNGKLGSILVDGAGNTLYTLTRGGRAIACTGPCLTAWPPLLLASGATSATPGAGVSGLATTTAVGGTQVTENGIPLYHFSGDSNPGDANGDGISSFGGTWHVVKAMAAAATATTAPAVAPPASPTTTSGYGY
jgi:predicted lipoprotein with Yx(FWY)xxD motif